MTVSPAREAIALLIDLAQRGEIDPWDVQVIEAIDRFLSELGLNGQGEPNYDRADLPQSGQTFLWASMLVLLKADTLQRLEEDEEQPELEVAEFAGEEANERALPLHLERHIRRRPTAPPPRKRRVTLQELIEQIEQIAAVLDSAPDRSTQRRSRSLSRRATARAIAQLAHDENLTEVAAQLEQFLTANLSQFPSAQDFIHLEHLLDLWTSNKHKDEDLSSNKSKEKVGIFWALLLLSAQSKVELSQEEFYQDLKIKPLINEGKSLRENE
ncbi:MAG: segregation/condensation protein A [Oscillatoria sp. PMC 1051.18]|nr:segregation/condensation protein A [Oscillatoria sp. PMC 1050.18]MEC5030040.1 segregation/condensation protein A [Oscillatoria sp. PMC 1051.18]